MCGIAGAVSRRPEVDSSKVKYLQQALIHRGPDGEGEYIDSHVALAMRRLAIIDIKSGQQPFFNEDRSLVLIANGEIYNHVELRAELEQTGHVFATQNDCETILHLYEEHGLDCVHALRGMFAFALWDSKARRLLLVRDRMGEKPLYIYNQNEQVFFSSELKSLLNGGSIPFEPDPIGINWFFHYGYPPEPVTPIKNVRKLPAGHLLIIDVDSWEIEQHKWWCLEDAPPLEAEPEESIQAVLEETARIIVRSDVPLGVALSGGLDSSLVAALVTKTYSNSLQAISIGYRGQPLCDERADARQFANELDIPIHEIELSIDEVVRSYPEMVRSRDDPIADISGSSYFAIMQAASERNIPVMFMGHGADELCWGYPWVQQAGRENALRAAIALGKTNVPSVRPSWPRGRTLRDLHLWATRERFGLRKSKRYVKRIRESDPNFLTFMELTPDFVDGANVPYTEKFKESLASAADDTDPRIPYASFGKYDGDGVLTTKAICDTYLLENGIAQGDRLSMAASVELRLPLVDYRLVETIIGLRKTRPDVDMDGKFLFRKAISNMLPDFVLDRPKRGFQPPVQQWRQALMDHYGAYLKDGLLVDYEILTPEGAKRLAKGKQSGHSIIPLFFKALTLEVWFRGILEDGSIAYN